MNDKETDEKNKLPSTTTPVDTDPWSPPDFEEWKRNDKRLRDLHEERINKILVPVSLSIDEQIILRKLLNANEVDND